MNTIAHEITPPTEDQIEETIDLLYTRLEEPGMKLKDNAQVKEGYEASIDILADDVRTYAGVKGTGTQSRAIQVLAVDYLNGECEQKVLLGVPVKVPVEMRLRK